MTSTSAPIPETLVDPTLAVAERQLALLGELGQMAMRVSRAFEASAIASAEAAQGMLIDKYFIPEVGRANACGARDAAESFQKVSRAVRLTFMLEKSTAEWLRDLRAGVITLTSVAASVCGAKETRLLIGGDPTSAPPVDRIVADDEGQAARVERPGGDRERLFDIEHPERLPKGSYTGLVDDLAADIGVRVDWDTSTLSAPELGVIVPPPDLTDPGKTPDSLATVSRRMALSP